MELKRSMGIGNATKLPVFTETQLAFFENHSLNCYKHWIISRILKKLILINVASCFTDSIQRIFLRSLLLPYYTHRTSLIAQSIKNLPAAMQETQVQFLGQEDPLEKEMATHSSILAWRIPWGHKRRT